MLDKFFIIIGESALSLIYSVKNFSLKHENNADKEQNNEIIKSRYENYLCFIEESKKQRKW